MAGVRVAPRRLPAADASEFVSRSLRSMPRPHHATGVAHCRPEAAGRLVGWAGADVEAIDDETTRVSVGSESLEWLVSTVAMLAVVADVDIDGPPELVAGVRDLSVRLTRATARDGAEEPAPLGPEAPPSSGGPPTGRPAPPP